MSYNSKYSGEEVEQLLDKINSLKENDNNSNIDLSQYVTIDRLTEELKNIENTDTKVTSVDNHYTPIEDEEQVLNAPDGEAIVGIKRDAAGHIVNVNTSPFATKETVMTSETSVYADGFRTSNGDWFALPGTGSEINSDFCLATADDVYNSTHILATCNTSGGTVAKVVTLNSGHIDLTIGTRVLVKFEYSHTASSMTLNVNSTGAKTCQYKGANIGSGNISAKGVYDFIYDGTYWQLLGGVVPSTPATVSNAYNPLNYATCATAAATAAKTASITGYSLVAGKQVRVKFTYANTASAPTLNISSTGAKSMCFNDGTLITSSNFTFKTDRYYLFTYNGTYYVLENNDNVTSLGRSKNALVYFSCSPQSTLADTTFHTANGETPVSMRGGVAYLMYGSQVVSQAIPLGYNITPIMPIKVASIVLTPSGDINTWQDVYIACGITASSGPIVARIFDEDRTQITEHNLANCVLEGHIYGTFK